MLTTAVTSGSIAPDLVSLHSNALMCAAGRGAVTRATAISTWFVLWWQVETESSLTLSTFQINGTTALTSVRELTALALPKKNQDEPMYLLQPHIA